MSVRKFSREQVGKFFRRQYEVSISETEIVLCRLHFHSCLIAQPRTRVVHVDFYAISTLASFVRFSNPPTIEVFNFTLLVEKKIENKSVYAKKRKMEEIVTYETLLFALVNFSIARLIVNLNRGANLAWISANYFLAWPPLRYLLFFLFSFFFSTLHFTEHNRAAVLIQSSSLLQVTDRGQCWPLIKEVS